MRVAAVFVGMPRSVTVAGRTLFTGGAKASVEEAFLRFDSFDGDGQGNLQMHGGRDRSACVYVAEHYDWWKSSHGFELIPGAFCENLTVEGAGEDHVCIGDVFRVGHALAQVSLPRDPCRTLGRLTGIPGLGSLARESGKCGFHMRTLEEGLIRVGDAFELVRRDHNGITIAMTLDLFHGRSKDNVLAHRLALMPEFAEQGKKDIARRLAGK
jgi:MOSC domain-containing protein YiiM